MNPVFDIWSVLRQNLDIYSNIMVKKSHKRPARPKKDNAGCMSGLIGMFDFRQGRFTQKLLPDRKFGSDRHGGIIYSKNKFDVPSNLEEKHEDISGNDSKRVVRDDLGKGRKASIKALMAGEMIGARASKKIPSSRVEQLRTDLGFENHKKRQNQNYKLGSNHDVDDLGASQCTWSDPSESSSFDVNLAELMVEFYRENHERQDRKNNCLDEPDAELTSKHYMLQKALRDITEALITQNSVDSKQVTSHGDVQPKEFMDALETLNSNEDVFLKLLQNPNSLLFKYILDLQNTQTGEILQESKPEESVSCQPSHKQTKHHFFRKKDKSDGTKASNESSSQALKRIVVLKPSPTRYEQYSNVISPISSPKSLHSLQNHDAPGRVSSHFSLKEIKRRLRNIVSDSKKEGDLIARDGVLHKIPYGFQNSDKNSKTSSSTQRSSKLSALLKRGDNDAKLKQRQFQKKIDKPIIGEPSFRESIFYGEAKKRLAEMLTSDGQNGVSSPRKVSKSLGRILSLPGYNSSSPRFNPGRDKQVDSPVLLRSSTLQKIKDDDSTYNVSSTQAAESLSLSDSNQDNEPQPSNSSPTIPEAQLHIGEVLIQEGSTRTEVCESLNILVEFDTVEQSCSGERCNEEGSPMISDSGPFEEALPLTPSVSVSPNSILVQKFEAPESTAENLDRPSPVSVLEPFFSEDINSPARTETDHAELTAEPRQLSFAEHGDSQLVQTSTVSEANLRTCTEDKETKLKYVRTVVQASGLNLNKLSVRWKLSDQLLDPFVFDEVEILYGQLIDDPKLLFDCINEVLVEIRDRYLSCSPWLSSIKPKIRPTPMGENFMHEVCKGVDQHLQIVSPYTLDHVVRKDLEEETWMNVMLETEGAVFDIEEVILAYIMEETILELWD